MKKNIIKLFSILLFTFLFIENVSAREIAQADQYVLQEGEYNSIRLIAGNSVTNKAKIDGLSLGAGNNVTASGEVEYGFYAGNVININEKVKKDLFVAGNSITIDRDASLGRDVFVAGSSVIINTNIPRDLRAGGESVVLGDVTIGGDAYIDADRITLTEKTVITGTLYYPSNAEIKNIDKASIGNIEVRKVEIDEDDVKHVATGFAVGTFIVFLAAAVISLLIVLGLVPSLKEKFDRVKFEFNEIAVTCLIGCGVLIILPVVSIFTVFTGILTPITLVVLALYAICIYLAPLFASYIIGSKLNNALFKKNGLFLSALMGVLLVRLVGIIPLIGGLVKFLVLIYGLGITFKTLERNVKKK